MLGAPFELPGDERGVLCVHGFTGSPYDVRYLGQRLAARGYTVWGPLLPGHQTSVADLDQTRWRDWSDAVDHHYERLRARCRTVAVVGQSLGGLLALHLAARRNDVDAVAALATPLWLEGVARWVAELTGPGGGLHGRVRRLPKLGGPDVRDRQVRRENPCYRAFPLRALGELLDFMTVVDRELPQVRAPVLVMHSQQDHTAPVACAARIAARTHAVKTRILHRSYHLLAIDVERDLVADEVAAFLEPYASRSPAPPA